MSIYAMCAFCTNQTEIENSRMKINDKLSIRVNFSCACRMPDVLHVILKPVNGIDDFTKQDVRDTDLRTGSPLPDALTVFFKQKYDGDFCTLDELAIRRLGNSTSLSPQLAEMAKFRTMADTVMYQRFMSMWAYKYLPFNSNDPETFPIMNNTPLVKDCNIPTHMLVSMTLFKLNHIFKSVDIAANPSCSDLLNTVSVKGQLSGELHCFVYLLFSFIRIR